MTIYSARTQEINNQLVANKVSPTCNGAESTFQFANSNPDQGWQKEFYQMANNHSLSNESQAFQRIFHNHSNIIIQKKENPKHFFYKGQEGVGINLLKKAGEFGNQENDNNESDENKLLGAESFNSSDTIQYKKLEKDSLNVAGEDHKVSDNRREAEKEFSKDRTGTGNYWTEQEFFSYSESQGKTQFGDPPELRILQSLTFMLKRGKNFINNPHNLEVEFINQRKEISQLQMEIALLNDLIYKNQEGKTYTTKDKTIHNTIKEELKKFSEVPTTLIELENAFRLKSFDLFEIIWARYYYPLEKTYIKLKSIITESENSSKHVKEKEEDLMICNKRSWAMNQAAKSEKKFLNRKGVWKIGDLHVIDIKEGVPVEYNLVTEKEFEEDFQDWMKEIRFMTWEMGELSTKK